MGKIKGVKHRTHKRTSKYEGLKPGTYEYHKAAYMKHLYGITMEEYNGMFEEQQGCCAICGTHQKDLDKKLHVDHCHNTGKVRGLLCFKCNTAIGILKDDPVVVLSAFNYLVKNN